MEHIPFGRTNYFKVKNADRFRSFCERWDVQAVQKDGLYGFSSDFGIPDHEEGQEEGQFLRELSQHLTEDSIAIIQIASYTNGDNGEMIDTVILTFTVNAKGLVIRLKGN